MKTILASLILAMVCASATAAGGLRGATPEADDGDVRSLLLTQEITCARIMKGKRCKKREDCVWSKKRKSCAAKKAAPPVGDAAGAERCRGLHDHTKPLPGGVAPFAWKTNDAGGRNAANRFSDRLAKSCCAVSPTEATTLTWAAFVAGLDPWCLQHQPVTVPCGTKVLVDGRELGGGQPIALAGLYVEGELEFVDEGGDVELRTDFLLNCGVFRAGAPDKRYESKLDIVLTGQKELWWRGSNFGKTGFVTHGGETYLRSASCDKPTWTRLAATAEAGATELTVQQHIGDGDGNDDDDDDAATWRVGDQLLVTTTWFHVKHRKQVQSEVVTVAGFQEEDDGINQQQTTTTVVRLAKPLQHRHLGCEKQQQQGGNNNNNNSRGSESGDGRSAAAAGCVMAAEVAPLSRNVQVRGEAASRATQKGGHFMMSHTNHGTICGVEFGPFLGQRITKGKYPLHFHAGWTAPELVVRSNAVHHSFNRGMVVHAMREMTIVDNTVYHTLGHNFMLEDGVEERNKLVHNLGVMPIPVDWRPSKGCCLHAAEDDDGDKDGGGSPEEEKEGESSGDDEDESAAAAAGGIKQAPGARRRRALASFRPRAAEDSARCPGVTKDTCGNRSDGVPNAFWIPNPRNSFIDNTGVAELAGKAFRIETRSVIGDTVLWFRPEAEKIGRKGKIKNVVPMGFTAAVEAETDEEGGGGSSFFGYVGNVAHSSSIGFLNYPMLRPGGPRPANYDRYVAWRNHMGISVRNTGRPLEVTGATLVENNYGVLAHIYKSRVKVSNSRIVGSGRANSLPFKMKKTKDVQKTLVAVVADEKTKRWARCRGGFTHKDAAVLLLGGDNNNNKGGAVLNKGGCE